MEAGRKEREAAARAFEGLDGAALRALVGSDLRQIAECGFEGIAAAEGTVWLELPLRRVLIPVFNSGRHGERFYEHEQSIDSGMLGMVFQTETPVVESDVYRNRSQDPSLDRKLGLLTCSMVAVPLVFFGQTRGVISAIRSKAADSAAADPDPFPVTAVAAMQQLAGDWALLLEQHWLALWSKRDKG